MIWARDLGTTKVSKSSEYFVYWGLFEMNCWDKRSDQIAKGEFLEVPIKKGLLQNKRFAAVLFGIVLTIDIKDPTYDLSANTVRFQSTFQRNAS